MPFIRCSCMINEGKPKGKIFFCYLRVRSASLTDAQGLVGTVAVNKLYYAIHIEIYARKRVK